MNTLLPQCPKCKADLTDGIFNQADLVPCPRCENPLIADVYPAYFRPLPTGDKGEKVLFEGESSCFYHPQKKATVPCDACGRFLCALCDCELKGRHLCPSCLETGHKKKSLQGFEDQRTLHNRQALMLAFVPFYITGIAALYLGWRYRREPGSLVRPMRWAFPVTMIVASLQVLGFTALILFAFLK
jgi:hypothetical protein